MIIPPPLLNQVREGRAVLFLGAGATIGAQVDTGKPPVGDELRDLIADRFLPNGYSDESLAWVSELAQSSTDLMEVQDFIADQFRNIQPAAFHELIPTFAWRGIATTNYDRLVEVVYDRNGGNGSSVVPFLSDDDRVDEKLRNKGSVGLLKLHGCVTRTHDTDLPLILTMDQYATYRSKRTRLFAMLEEWAAENPLIFVGHRMLDPNLRGILVDLLKRLPAHPRYYLVRPKVDQVEKDFWAARSVSVLDGTFSDFLEALDKGIDRRTRVLAPEKPVDHPVRTRFVTNDPLSSSLLGTLEHEVEYVEQALPDPGGRPEQFYRGEGQSWFPILNDLDVRRKLTDTLLEDIILRPEDDRPSRVELYVIRAEAGAGKSVLLRRLAWEAATRAGALCLYLRSGSGLSFGPVKELADATGERVFLFIDNASQRGGLIRDALSFARGKKVRLTIVSAERINEWNVSCDFLEDDLSDSYELRYLSRSEIERLVELLDEHGSLGPYLRQKTPEQRVEEFVKRAGRQLLVALHEATMGRPFVEILHDEYERIVPEEAKRLYLTVCTLNRLKVPVRAGLVSRIHGIPFEEFQKRLFRPLERVVNVSQLPWGDYAYRARHSEIATVVFNEALQDPTDRFNEYVRVVRALNPMYSIDSSALKDMVRAKAVHDLFPNYEDGRAVFDVVAEVLPDNPHVLQQRANYERIRPDGNLRMAESLLQEARELAPSDPTITHTLAEVLRKKAETAERPLERSRYRGEAAAVLRGIDSGSSTDKYAVVTRLKLATDEVRDLLSQDQVPDRQLDEAIREAEKSFNRARQRYPGEQFVLSAEADFANTLRDHKRSREALESARRANPRDPFIASRLAAMLSESGEADRAKEYLEEALESNSGDKRLNFQYAELLRGSAGASPDELVYFYRKSFTKWDQNYESQFWFARFLYEDTDPEKAKEAKEVFRRLRDVPLSHAERIRIRDTIGGPDAPKPFSGTVVRVEATHGFVSIDGRGDWLFFHRSAMDESTWSEISAEKRVTFAVGFNLRGPTAIRIRLET